MNITILISTILGVSIGVIITQIANRYYFQKWLQNKQITIPLKNELNFTNQDKISIGIKRKPFSQVSKTVVGIALGAIVLTPLTAPHAADNILNAIHDILLVGRINIGSKDTRDPRVILKIAGDNKDVRHFSYGDGPSGDKGDYEFFRARGNEEDPQPVNSGDQLGSIRFGGYAENRFLVTSQIRAVAKLDDAFGLPTSLEFSAGNGSRRLLQTQMRITESGVDINNPTIEGLLKLPILSGTNASTLLSDKCTTENEGAISTLRLFDTFGMYICDGNEWQSVSEPNSLGGGTLDTEGMVTVNEFGVFIGREIDFLPEADGYDDSIDLKFRDSFHDNYKGNYLRLPRKDWKNDDDCSSFYFQVGRIYYDIKRDELYLCRKSASGGYIDWQRAYISEEEINELVRAEVNAVFNNR